MESDEVRRGLEIFCERKDNFVTAEIKNYFFGEIILSGGLSVTTKENDDYHDYGIKSTGYIIQK